MSVIHRIDCVKDTVETFCMGCELSLCYEAIRALIAQRGNPQRDENDNEEWKRAINLAQSVLPEFQLDE